jgi:hypothetical protein
MKHTNTSFTKPDNSAACSQDSATGPYPVHTFLEYLLASHFNIIPNHNKALFSSINAI